MPSNINPFNKMCPRFLSVTILVLLLPSGRLKAMESQALHGHVPTAVSSLRPIGNMPATNRMKLALSLPLRNREALTNLLRDIYDPASPNFHHYLTPEKFAERFGPKAEDYEAVATFAESHGLKVTTRHPNRTILDVEGAVSEVESAFHVKLRNYQHPKENRIFHAPDTEPTIELAVPVLHIDGLDDYALPQPRLAARRLDATPAVVPNVGSGPGGTYRGGDFRAAYAPNVTLNGAGQSVGLLQFDGYNASDIANYETQAGLPNVPLVNVLLDGFNGAPSGFGGEVEVCLDIEMSISMAPGLSKVIVYMAGPYGNWHDILNRMATDNLARQLSCSWYSPGAGPDSVADQIWQQMAAQGQSFFNASGDYDAYTGPIDFPGDTPYITQVGGTYLNTSARGGPWVSETVWNRNNGIGTGGGVSTSYPIPSWQAGLSMTANLGSTTLRNTPDVAFTADNVYVRADGVDWNVGGTSCAAPLWAGFASLVNQQATIYGQPSLGFANPAVYALGTGPIYGLAFHDITMGNNIRTGSGNRFPATTGYDLCTGWGTPNGQGFIDALVNPDALVVSPPVGFTSAGAVGGPFSVTSQNYVVTNAGSNSLVWTLSNTSLWLNASLSGGTLGAGSATNLTVSLNSAASNLPPGFYTNTIAITNLTSGFGRGLTYALQLHDPLVITPTNGFSSLGPVGGPFTVTSGILSLSNSGAAGISWSLVSTSSWITASPSNGSLAPGLVGAVAVNLTAAANGLPPALYTGDILFSNFTSGNVQDRQFSLQTGQLPVQNGGFETGNFLGWSLSGNTAGSSVTAAPYAHSGTNGARLGSPSMGFLSQTLTTVPGQIYLISFWLEDPGGTIPNEFQVNWNGTTVLDLPNFTPVTWTNIQMLVAALTTNTVLQFGFANPSSYFGLDDISVFQTQAAPTPPTITLQPTNVSVTAGLSASFTVGVTGIPPFFYQWQLNGTNVPNATNASLAFSPATTNMGGSYVAAVSNAFGSVVSSNAVLTVVQPACDPVPAGIAGWWAGDQNALDSSSTNDGALQGAAGFVGGIVGTAFDFTGTNAYAQVPARPAWAFGSSDFSIELWAKFPLGSSGTRAFAAYDAGQGKLNKWIFFLNNGLLQMHLYSTSLGVVYLGSGAFNPATNQWYHVALTRSDSLFTFYVNGQVNSTTNSSVAIPDAQSPLTIGTAENLYYLGGYEDEVAIYNRALSAGEIRAVYNAGAAGKCQSAAPPAIVSQPQSGTVAAGASATLSVGATGSKPLYYQWNFNGTNLANATSASLTLNPVTTNEAGIYSAAVSNAYGSTISSNATLNVAIAACVPVPSGVVSWWAGEGNASDTLGTNSGVLQGAAGFTSGEVGMAFDFTGTNAYAQVPARSQWAFGTNDFSIELWARFPLGSSGTRAFAAYDAGQGKLNKWIFFLNNGLLQMHLYSDSLGVVYLGSGAFNPAPNQWYHVALTRSGSLFTFYVNGAVNSTTASSVAIPDAQSPLTIGAAENLYYLGGYEDEVAIYSRALSAAEIQAIYNAGNAGKCQPTISPTIVVQPQSQSAFAGTTINFNVSAAGAPPLSYQWSFNGTNIAGATDSSLVLAQVQTNQTGNYSVVITNQYGSILSSNAMLTVNVLPPCAPVASGTVGWWEAEGDALDTMGTNNGVLVGAAGFTSGVVGTAFDFTGSSAFVQVPARPQWAFGTSNFTIELWARFPAAASGTRAFVAYDAGQGTLNKWIFFVNNGLLQMHLYSSSIGVVYLGSGAFNPTPNQWYHVAMTRNGSLFTFYVNGATNSTTASSVSVPDAQAPLTIGTAENLYYLGGYEDEVGIYNRALSGSEIQAIYNVGAGGKCQPAVGPLIVTQPQNETNFAGNSASFSVAAAGAHPLSYQWQFDGTNVAGATKSILTLANIQPGQAGIYSVLVSNFNSSTFSSNAMLTVNVPPACTPPAPGMVSWWAGAGNASDTLGTNNGTLQGAAGFTNGAVGTGFDFTGANAYVQVPTRPAWAFGTNNFSIELWAKFPLGSSGTRAFAAYDAGQGTLNKWIFFLNNGLLQMHLYSTSLGVVYLGSGAFSPATNQWYHVAVTRSNSLFTFYVNGQVNSTTNTGVAIPDAQSPLTIGTAENLYYLGGYEDEVAIYNRALSAGEIQAIYNAGAGGKCNPNGAPYISTQPQNQIAIANSNATFSVSAAGEPPLSYQWQLNGTNLSGATNSTFTLMNVQDINAGNYSVVITNALGSITSSNASLVVFFAPSITHQPRRQLARPGCTVSFASGATGTPPLSYQWHRNGLPLTGQTATNLVVSNITSFDFGTYTMMASNAYGTATSTNASLDLDNVPVAGATTVFRYGVGGLRINVGAVLANDTDPDGDGLGIAAVNSNSVAGGTVSLSDGSIYYAPPAGLTNADSFDYLLVDGHCGGTATGTVLVEVRQDTNPAPVGTILPSANGSVRVIFDGIPGYTYRIQAASSLTLRDWQDVAALMADQFGSYVYTDYPATNGPTRYFRSVYP